MQRTRNNTVYKSKVKFSVINTVDKDTAKFHKAPPELLSLVLSGRHWIDEATCMPRQETLRIARTGKIPRECQWCSVNGIPETQMTSCKQMR